MKCTNCGAIIKSTQQIWQERQRARGNCISCGKPKPEKDEAFDRCRRCRIKKGESEAKKRARRKMRGALAV